MARHHQPLGRVAQGMLMLDCPAIACLVLVYRVVSIVCPGLNRGKCRTDAPLAQHLHCLKFPTESGRQKAMASRAQSHVCVLDTAVAW
jgi:hypothetical protein